MTNELEKHIQRQVMDYLHLIGAVPIRVNSGAFGGEYKGKKRFVRANSEPGCSDILACYRGQFLAIEVKRPKTFLTEKQKGFLDKIDAAGGHAWTVRSIEDIQRLVSHLDTVIESEAA